MSQQPHLNVNLRLMDCPFRALSHVISIDSMNVIVIYVPEIGTDMDTIKIEFIPKVGKLLCGSTTLNTTM